MHLNELQFIIQEMSGTDAFRWLKLVWSQDMILDHLTLFIYFSIGQRAIEGKVIHLRIKNRANELEKW